MIDFIWLFSWNETAFRDEFDNDPELIRDTMLNVLRKFIFFAEDMNVMKNFSEKEEFVIDNYGKQIPSLLQKVSTISFIIG